MKSRGVIFCCVVAFLAGVDFIFSETPKPTPEKSEPASQPGKPVFPEGRRVFLTKELASEIDSFARVENDRSWAGATIRVGGRAFQRGLGVHSDSRLVFQPGGEFATFNVVAGPDDAHHGQIEMKILVDGEEKWSSGPTRSHDKKHRRRLAISVKDAQTLTLLVLQSDGNKGGDHASWANAYVERVPRKRETVAHATTLLEVKDKLEPFLRDYCIDCHGPDRQRGQVRFDTADWEITNNDTAQRWQDVLDQLNGGDMPPEDADQPFDDELATALDALTGAVLEARQRLTDHGGEIKMRRLNQREYSATIRELFGFHVALDEIPEDGEIASFDTVGAEQFFNSSHFEKYLELGKKIGAEALRFNVSPRRPVETERLEVEEKVTPKLREKLADLDRKMELKKQGATWEEMGFKDEGEMEIIFRQWDSRAELPRRYLQYPKVDTGVYLSDVAKFVTFPKHTDIRGEYIIRVKGGVLGQPDEMRKVARIFDRNRIFGTVKMAGTPDAPETVEMRVQQPMGRSFLAPSIRENMPDHTIGTTMRGYLRRLQGPGEVTDPRAALWIDWMEIEGPFYPGKRPIFEDILYAGKETGHGSPYIWNDGKIRELIEKFTYEAFRRRTPDPEYIERLHQHYLENRAAEVSPRNAFIEIMGIVLASPGFLFIQENETTGNEQQELTDRELAIRLAYYLWSAPPDEDLYSAAADGSLHKGDNLEKQIERMLSDPRSRQFRDGFIGQWAEFDRYDAITVDNREHYRFNEGIQQDAKQEVVEFFGALLEENLPARNLVDSDFAMLNGALAAHYGIDIENPKSSEFQKTQLPADSPRGGFMTQAMFLTTGSNGERSSPVIRGALVMEKLLHDEPAPPPPNVPELGSADDRPRTNREMVEMHQEQAVCASCHKKMDVIGFGLENFDTIGRWRDFEKVGNQEVPIDPGGTLPDGSAFATIQELKEVLIEHEEELARQLIESMLAYALGRTIEFSDADDVDQLIEKVRDDGYRIRDMIREVALSPLFRKK